MIKIGITGNIGSGKSLVSSVFESLHWPVFNSDLEAKTIMTNDSQVISKIKEIIGENAYFPNGDLNRKAIAEIVFSNPAIRETINHVVHPAVEEYFERWCLEKINQKIICKESALLFETGIYKKMDMNILVTADLETRIGRVMVRDGANQEQVLSRIKAQWNQEEKLLLADYVIENNDKKYLIRNCLEVYRKIKEKFKV